MTPTLNTGPSLENLIFDPTYYSLSALILVLAFSSALAILLNRNKFTDNSKRSLAVGIGLVALGYGLIFIIAVTLLALFRGGTLAGFLYLQIEFALVYLGCGLVLFGVDNVLFGPRALKAEQPTKNHLGRNARPRSILWIAFFVSVGIALIFLFDTQTYTVTIVGGTMHVAQEAIFWLPPAVTMIVGAICGLIIALKGVPTATSSQGIYLILFFFLEIVGMLKESNIIQSLGDPFADLLLAFVPFSAGAVCLAIVTWLTVKSVNYRNRMNL